MEMAVLRVVFRNKELKKNFWRDSRSKRYENLRSIRDSVTGPSNDAWKMDLEGLKLAPRSETLLCGKFAAESWKCYRQLFVACFSFADAEH